MIGTYKTSVGTTDIQIAFSDNGWKVQKLSDRHPGVEISGSWKFLDGNKKLLYFYTLNKNRPTDQGSSKKDIEIRNSIKGEPVSSLYLYNCWNFETGNLTVLHRDEMTDVLATSVEGYFIGYSTDKYDLRDFRGLDRADFYLIRDGHDPILIEKEITKLNKHLLIHPNKPYIVYYKDGYWWSYNFLANEKKCLTKNLHGHFNNNNKGYLYETDHHGVLGFSSQNSEILIYDEFDIWSIDLDGAYTRKCTTGDDTISYRWAGDSHLPDNQFRDTFFTTHMVNTNELILKAKNTKTNETALVLMDRSFALKELLPAESYRILGVVGLTKGKYLVKRENYSTPPQYLVTGKKLADTKILQSNEHYKKFEWGKSELFNIPLADGASTKAALIYPAFWEPEKKYPLIVYYYEKTSSYGMYYKIPTFHNLDGFNNTIFSQKGFFVLYIDMRFVENEVTRYLLDDTNIVLDHLIEKVPSINKDKLGMIGHSFGGYEVMYLAGQTNRFKAAVAGAGVSDLYDLYFADKDKGSLGMFTVENVQFKTQAPFFNKNFNAMNPLQRAGNIETPLLLWTGEKDYRIRKEHSIKMYLALWRQKKEAELLIYKDEYHYLKQVQNTKDLTERIIRFFEEKLK